MAVLNKLFTDKTNNIHIQFFRYIFVGGAAYIVDIGMLVLFTEVMGIYYVLSATLSFALGLVVNYILSTSWIFNISRIDKKAGEFAIFALIGIVGLALNAQLIWIFTEYARFHYVVSKLVSTIFVFCWNFFARRYFLFR